MSGGVKFHYQPARDTGFVGSLALAIGGDTGLGPPAMLMVENCGGAGEGTAPQGPVDHRLPLLCAADEQGNRLAIVVHYACHCTTLTDADNTIYGDWAGAAQQFIEQENPGATAMVFMGCGADANPDPRGKFDMALANGRAVADEVRRLLAGRLQPIRGTLACATARCQIPCSQRRARRPGSDGTPELPCPPSPWFPDP